MIQLLAALALLCVFASPAIAARSATALEFDEIRAAIPEEHLEGGYYCPTGEKTWISTLDPNWALVEMSSNCGIGSQTIRFFFSRALQEAAWQLTERQYERLGTGEGAPCAHGAVPVDIRCGRTSLGGKVILGSRNFTGPGGKGFGTQRPKTIYNGGVPSGLIVKIRWKKWGQPVAIGRGRGHQYKPRGGYYKRRVAVRLRAQKIGKCNGSQPRAYTQLLVSMQKRPGGPFGRWFRWSGRGSICEGAF